MYQNEKIVETKTCKHCTTPFSITDKDLEFYEKISPTFKSPLDKGGLGDFGKNKLVKILPDGTIKYLIPTPTLCPECRQQRRLSFRNERKLYKRKCDATGKDIISIYSPDKPYTVYHQNYWWSDNWDPMEYGKEFDFSKGFFEQFEELMKKVPQPNLITDYNLNENSEYVNFSGASKNCYLVFENGDCENDLYSYFIYSSKDCIDTLGLFGCSNCYECINVNNCSYLFYCVNSDNCTNSYFLKNCENLKNCCFCYNLRNKRYCILNKQYSKDEYFIKLEEILKNGFRDSFQEYLKYNFLFFDPENHNKGNENVSGEFIKNSNNIKDGYYVSNMRDSSFVSYFQGSSNIYDCHSWGYDIGYGGAERCYESVSVGNGVDRILFSYLCRENLTNVLYSHTCRYSSNLFGCIGLRNKSYCILNKQYTKEEYETLVPRIIEHMMKTGEWGEFFPSSVSHFGYNETVAQEYFPIASSQLSVISQQINTFKTCKLSTGNGELKINWSDYEAPFPHVEKIIPASKLPDDISKIPDDILNWAIECEVTKKPFRIIKQELEFYRKHHLPIPRRHPDQRHLDRMKLRNPRKLFERKCDKCGKEMQTTYAPERPEIVYCEECYNREVY